MHQPVVEMFSLDQDGGPTHRSWRSGSWSMFTTNYSYTHIHWMCLCNPVMIPSGHMTSILLSILERDPPLLLSWRFYFTFPPWKDFFYYLGVFSLIRCDVKGQGCRTCTDCKALWGEFIICDVGRYQINWIEFKCLRSEDSVTQRDETHYEFRVVTDTVTKTNDWCYTLFRFLLLASQVFRWSDAAQHHMKDVQLFFCFPSVPTMLPPLRCNSRWSDITEVKGHKNSLKWWWSLVEFFFLICNKRYTQKNDSSPS